MKKKLLYVAAFLLIASSFHSCEGVLENCQICRYNLYDADMVYVSSELEAEYCGTDLIARKAAPDVVVLEGTANETTTKFECDN